MMVIEDSEFSLGESLFMGSIMFRANWDQYSPKPLGVAFSNTIGRREKPLASAAARRA